MPDLAAVDLFAAAGLPPSAAVEAMGRVVDIACDSRQVRPGSLFVAWQGGDHDGHAFAAEAGRRGAVGVVSGRDLADVGVPVYPTPRPRQALAQLARALWRDPSAELRMVGITGTNGKTTCAAAIGAIIDAALGAGAAGVIGTLGARLGDRHWPSALTTPEAHDLCRLLADMRTAGGRAAVLEASSQALAQERLDAVAFDVALFTQLGDDHHEWHGGRALTFAAKARLFGERLKPRATAVLPAADPWAARLPRPAGAQVIWWGEGPGADVRPRTVAYGADATEVSIETPAGPVVARCPLVGRINLANILAACAVGCALSIGPQAIAAGLASMVPPAGRMQRLPPAAGLPAVFVDYAHTPMAVAAALAAIRPLCAGRVLCVIGCGGERDVGKRRPMGAAAAAGADLVFVTDDNPRGEAPEQILDAVAAGVPAARCRRVPGRQAAIQAAIEAAGPDDAVAILGRGHETHQLVGGERRPLDDAACAAACLAGAGAASGPRAEHRR